MAVINKANITTSFRDAAGATIIGNVDLQSDLVQNLTRTLDSGATNVEFDVAITKAAIIGMALSVAKSSGEAGSASCSATVKTNSTSDTAVSGTNDIFDLTPTGIPGGLAYYASGPYPNPFTVDVTKLYITNTGTAKCDITLRLLLDSSPSLAG